MPLWYDSQACAVFHGGALETLRGFGAGVFSCCVTNPPYWGLRDYKADGQLGLEKTPNEYVAKMVEVFREVRRTLRDDGTLWLNIGDSYAGSWGNYSGEKRGKGIQRTITTGSQVPNPAYDGLEKWRPPASEKLEGIKPKDLVGIPWLLATALRDPYYTGVIKNELDRVWMAAMLDAEGSICGTEYMTGDRTKTNLYISITNSSIPIIEKCGRLFPQESENVYKKGGTINREVSRWDVEQMDKKAIFIREIYPYLVAKRKQAILGYTFLEMQKGLPSKKKGYLPEQHEQRSWIMQSLSALNHGKDLDLPDWVIEPPSLFEPGFYLRQDIIWAKPNPMPESVTDRCTKSHEHIFLLAKSQKYYFDQEAIKEPLAASSIQRLAQDVDAQEGSWRVPGKTNGSMKAVGGPRCYKGSSFTRGKSAATHEGVLQNDRQELELRNKRDVWTISTQPFKDAHFAVFPPKLITPCILAGSPPGGMVLDPFAGSGTTLAVAKSLGRRAIGIELQADYLPMIRRRIDAVKIETAV